MKLAITGTHRVGKTTLAECLIESLPGYKVKPEPFYELEESGVVFSDSPTLDDFLEQLEYSIKQAFINEENIIFDRSPIDLLAYVHVLDRNKNIQALYKEVQNAINRMDVLIFLPIETPDLIKCSDSDQPSLRRQVDDILQEWIWDFDIKIIEVRGTLQNRGEQVLKALFSGLEMKNTL